MPPEVVLQASGTSTPSPKRRKQATQPTEDDDDTNLTFISALREDYNGAPFQLKHSNTPNSKLTDDAREQMVADYYALDNAKTKTEMQKLKRENVILKAGKVPGKKSRFKASPGRPKGVISMLAKHYEVTKSAVEKIVNAAQRGSSRSLPRPGRKKLLTPSKVKMIKEAFNEEEGPRSRRLEKLVSKKFDEGSVAYDTKYGDYEPRKAPTRRSIDRIINEELVIRTLRTRPSLTEANKLKRVQLLEPRLETVSNSFDTDEAYVEHNERERRIAFHPGEDVPDDTYHSDAAHGHQPKIFLSMVVTIPEMVDNVDGEPVFSETLNGKVSLLRVRGVKGRVKRRRDANGNFIALEDDEPVYENVNMDGHVYASAMTEDDGHLDAIVDYTNEKPNRESARVFLVQTKTAPPDYAAQVPKHRLSTRNAVLEVQEDNAGGHGFDNRHGGKPTPAHDWLADRAAGRGIRLIQQPPCSPETNLCDLAAWHILKSKVAERQHLIPNYTGNNTNEVEAALWEAVKAGWKDMSPRALFNAAHQKRRICELIVKSGGETVASEPHTGIRLDFGTGSPKRPLRSKKKKE
jgi:hypothetical protein